MDTFTQNRRLISILEKGLAGERIDRREALFLLGFHEASLEAGLVRTVAQAASRRRFHNEALLMGQIGVSTAPCPGNCRFCAFGKHHTRFPETRLTPEEVAAGARSFAAGGDLHALFLMTMHDFNFEDLLETIAAARRAVPAHTRIVVNIGDFDASQAGELKAAGVSGAYHVRRLREGTDTDLDPEARLSTFRVIREAGLDFYCCCEPIGPEHTGEELVEQMFLAVDFGCFQHAAMRRVYLPGSPLADRGQITELRLAQIVAVIALAALGRTGTQSIAVHEPNLIGLVSGANAVYAETGANPRDMAADTSGHRGRDMAACRTMLYEAGFTALRRGDGTMVPLTLESVTGGRVA